MLSTKNSKLRTPKNMNFEKTIFYIISDVLLCSPNPLINISKLILASGLKRIKTRCIYFTFCSTYLMDIYRTRFILFSDMVAFYQCLFYALKKKEFFLFTFVALLVESKSFSLLVFTPTVMTIKGNFIQFVILFCTVIINCSLLIFTTSTSVLEVFASLMVFSCSLMIQMLG